MAGSRHPVHPATVHFPLTFLSLAAGLDLLYGAATAESTAKVVANVYNVTPFLGDIARASHFVNILGLLSALPAIASGVGELLAVLKSSGEQGAPKAGSKDKAVAKGKNPRVAYGVAHAVINELAVAMSVYKWWSRRNSHGLAPDSTNILLSGLVLPGLLFAAFLGGILVYDHGVGVAKRDGQAKVKRY